MALDERDERFLAIALERRFLDLEQADEARRRSGRNRPIALVLMDLGYLDAQATDAVLSEMLEVLDREVEDAARLTRVRQRTAGLARLNRALESCPSFEKAYWWRIRAYVDGRCWEEAIADYTRLLELPR